MSTIYIPCNDDRNHQQVIHFYHPLSYLQHQKVSNNQVQIHMFKQLKMVGFKSLVL